VRTRRTRRGLAALLLALGGARTAAGSAAGGAEAGELDLPASALAAAVGPAAALLGRDASALADNPALLGRDAPAGVGASYAIRPLGFTDSQASGYLAGAGVGAAGVQLRLVQGDLTEVDEDGAGNAGPPAGPVDYQAIAATAGVAPDLAALTVDWPVRIRAGAAVTVFRRDLAGTIQSGWGGSAGAIAEWPFGVSGWFVARHVGWSGTTGWPVESSAGGAWTGTSLLLDGDRLTAALGGAWGRERGVGGVLAAEYGLEAGGLGAAVRAGWTPSTTPSASRWPAAGLVLRAAALSLEAGLAPMGDLGWVQVVTVAYQFHPAGE